MAVERVQRRLLEWYKKSGRTFPWRRTHSPYRILVAETMLQQTQTSRVVEKWKEFLRRYPDVRSLAAATPGDVIRQWNGLGYNARALRLHRCAGIVVEKFGGRFPVSMDELIKLPGVGRYTASALLCFASGIRVPVVDVNIRRVLTRLSTRVRRPDALVPESDAWKIAGDMLPEKCYYEWNQALMDLGAILCTARAPQCSHCPLSRHCPSAHAINMQRQVMSQRLREPMYGMVPRRLVRGAVIRYLRGVEHNDGVAERSIVRHIRTLWAGVTSRNVHEAVTHLIGDGLLVLRMKNKKNMRVSFP